jgi:hypothetical protein
MSKWLDIARSFEFNPLAKLDKRDKTSNRSAKSIDLTNSVQSGQFGQDVVGQKIDPKSTTIVGTEDFEERAAIIQYDGEIPVEWAEGLARLCVMSCPEGVDETRWRQAVDNAGLFADQWAAKANSLGWDTHDIYGEDRNKPEAAIHMAGLIWLLQDKTIVAITADEVIVETGSGARQTFKPRLNRGDMTRWALLWDL